MKKMLLSLICAASLTAYAGTGTTADPYSVAEVIAMGADLNVASATVKGYIVGYVDGQAISTGAKFTATGASYSNVLIADAQNCTDVTACVPVQLVQKTDIRAAVNLGDNPGNLGKLLTITGQLTAYFKVPGVKAPTAYVLEGEGGGGGVTPPSTDPVSSLDENFEAGSIPSNWSQVQVAGNKTWYAKSFSNNYYASMSGYNGTAPFDQWLLTPAIDMSKVTDKTLTFDTQVNYGSTTTVLEVYVLSSNDVATATKTKLDPTLAVAPASGYSSWAESGNIDLSSQSGIVYIGFRYYATADDNFATWCVDNVKLGVASAPVTVTEVNSIAEFLALPLESVGKINCTVTAVYQNGNYLYVTDGTTPLLIYGNLGKTYNNGDVIAAGITGKNTNFSQGQLQMSEPDATTFGAGTAGTAVEPEVYQIEELSADMVSSYIKILGVKVAAAAPSKGSTTLSDNTGEVTLYNQFGVTVGAGENLTFIGVVSVHNGTLQVLPVADLGDGGSTPTPSDDPNVAYFVAPTFADKTGCQLYNKDNSATQSANTDDASSLCGKQFTEKGVSLKFVNVVPESGTDYFSGAYGNHVRWYQGDKVKLVPATGVTITKVFVQTVKDSKGNFSATTGSVDGTGVGATNPITWAGSVTAGTLEFTSNKAIRFSYIEVTTTGFSGVEDVTVSDENAPVEYYNLQGIRVNNPEGGVFIRRQGNTVTKVLVK